ncbi:MAG: hypothetical protein KGH84_00320 [Paracoccaceae bacterium]|nr:hypothetical protein [Paracoccaceae bacterium]
MRPQTERLSHVPGGHVEAPIDAWANLYAKIGFAIAARRANVTLPVNFVRYTDAAQRADGVRFIEACADSDERQGVWVVFKQ